MKTCRFSNQYCNPIVPVMGLIIYSLCIYCQDDSNIHIEYIFTRMHTYQIKTCTVSKLTIISRKVNTFMLMYKLHVAREMPRYFFNYNVVTYIYKFSLHFFPTPISNLKWTLCYCYGLPIIIS